MADRYETQVKLPHSGSSLHWFLCSEGGCPGEAVNGGRCYLHLDRQDRAAYLREVADGNAELSLSGLTVTGPEFAAVIAAMDKDSSGNVIISAQARFYETTFKGTVDLQRSTWVRPVSFAKALFQGGVSWQGAQFKQGLDLTRATILQSASLPDLNIRRGSCQLAGIRVEEFLNLLRLTVAQDLDLRWAETSGVWLWDAAIGKDALMEGANFSLSTQGRPDDQVLGRFDGMRVSGTTNLSGARLPYETTIGGYADRKPSEFQGDVNLEGATFGSPVIGGRHLLQGLALDRVKLDDCTFHDHVSFRGCSAESRLELRSFHVRKATNPVAKDDNEHLFAKESLDLTDLSLARGGSLTSIAVEGSCALQCTKLDGELEITDLDVSEELVVRGTVFSYAPFSINAGSSLRFSRCQFPQGGILVCKTPALSFAECDARQPLTVTSSDEGSPSTRLVTLTQTNVEHFVLRNISLGPTRFARLDNLDQLRLRGVAMLRSPARLTRGRQIIFDEVPFRTRSRLKWRRGRWEKLAAGAETVTEDPPGVVADTYRALRKGLEDTRDAPGASDFYYGEMEMRRAAAPWLAFERWLLTAYWLFGGYALRASRALVALLLVLGVGGYLLDRHGFVDEARTAPDGTFAASLLLAQVTLALQRAPAGLTQGGSVIVIVARIACAALLALAVFALRSRVKR